MSQVNITTNLRTEKRPVIFQNFINEHNLWGTTAVLALSVHATVENNNLEFLLFSCSLPPPRPLIRPHFQFLTFFFWMSLFPLTFSRKTTTARGESTGFHLQHWQKHRQTPSYNPLLAAPTICTQINYILQIKKCYIVTS